MGPIPIGLVSPLIYGSGLAILALGAGGWSLARGTAAFALPLGLGVLAQGLFLLGAGGRFAFPGLLLIAGLAGALGLMPGGLARVAMTRAARGGPRHGGLGESRAGVGWRRAAIVLAGAGPALLALYPPVTWDDTTYHLPLAFSLVENGGYVFADRLRVPIYPLLAETLFAPALMLGRASTAHGVSLLATLATGALLLVWGRDRLGESPWSLVPVALWIGQPIVVFYAGSAYVEPLLTMFATAAAVAFDRWRRQRDEVRWLTLAGVFAGWAAATKYLGLYLVGILVLAAGAAALRGCRLTAAARVAGFAALAAVPWYFLIWVFTGNPLFPFFTRLFGDSAWSLGQLDSTAQLSGPVDLIVAVVRLGWDLTVSRQHLGYQPPASPLVVLALPLLIYVAARIAWTRVWVGALAGMTMILLLALPQDARFLMWLSPVLYLLLVAGLDDVARRAAPEATAWRRRVTVALAVGALLGGPLYAAYRWSRVGPPPASTVAVDDFLARRLPPYRALLFLRSQPGGDRNVYALHGERLHGFAGGRLLGELNGPHRYQIVAPLLDRPRALAQRLRGFGAHWLLLPLDGVPEPIVDGLLASSDFDLAYQDRAAMLLEIARRSPRRDE